MRMMPIASGSSGNCIYLGTEDTHVLFDAGISRTGFRSLPDIINVKHIRTMTAYRKYRNEFLKIKIFFSLDALIFILFFLSGKILYNNNR